MAIRFFFFSFSFIARRINNAASFATFFARNARNSFLSSADARLLRILAVRARRLAPGWPGRPSFNMQTRKMQL